jgi:hypothetical protein
MVSTELNTPLNRFDLIHPITPMLVKGGVMSSIGIFEDLGECRMVELFI